MKTEVYYKFGKCDICKSNNEHYTYGISKTESNKDKKIIFVLDYLDFDLENKFIFEGKRGNILHNIIKALQIDLDELLITTSFCCTSNENIDSIEKIKKYTKNLWNNILRFNSIEKIVVFGANALKCLLAQNCNIKDYRNKDIYIDHIKLGSTFSLFQVDKEPPIILDITNDVYSYINDKKIEDTIISMDYTVLKNNTKNLLSLDVETEGLNSFIEDKELLSIALSFNEKESLFFNTKDIMSKTDIFLDLIDLLEKDITLIGHNIKFDYLWLKNKLSSSVKVKLCDTKTMYIILDENSKDNSLKYLLSRLTTLPKNYDDGIDKSNLKELRDKDLTSFMMYNCRDSDGSLRLYNELIKDIRENGKENLLDFLNEVLLVIANIEYNGIKVDINKLKKESKEYAEKFSLLKKSYETIFPGLNLDSPKQLQEILYDKLKFPVINRTSKGMPSTDKETLNLLLEDHCDTELKFNFINDLINYSRMEKLYKTYYLGLEDFIMSDGRIHPNYNLGKYSTSKGSNGTVTGRLSCSEPNLTNIPRTDKKLDIYVRNLFCASDGYNFIDLDYSQLELRVGAWYSKEKKMYDLFNKGEDIHTSVLSSIMNRPYQELVDILKDEKHKEYSTIKNTRVIAKSINFGIFYGAGANTIQTQSRKAGLKITKEQAQEMIDKWLDSYPKVKKWINYTKKYIILNKEISSPTGRTRHLPGADKFDKTGYALLRQGINFPIQTLASEICLAALITVEKTIQKYNLDAKIVLTVHDSIIIEYNQNIDSEFIEKITKKAMTEDVVKYFQEKFKFTLDIPLEVSAKHSKYWE